MSSTAKRLFISKIPHDYNPSSDILLGPWCLLNNCSKIKTDDIVFEPDPFNSFEEIKKASKIARNVANHYLSELALELNSKFCWNYNLRFWHIYLMPWLLSAVHFIYLKQTIVNGLIKKYGHIQLSVELLSPKRYINFIDTLDFHKRGIMNLSYSYYIFSRLIEDNIPKNWNINYVDFEIPIKYNQKQTSKLKTKLADLYTELIPICSVYGVNKVEAFLFEILLFFKNHKKRKLHNLDNYQTGSAQGMDSIINFSDWYKYLKKMMPESIKNINIPRINLYRKKRTLILSLANFYYNDLERLKVAVAAYLGTAIVATQHGGSYGCLMVHSRPTEIEYKNDYFISWGWQETTYVKKRIIPLPSPMLSKMSHMPSGNKIIFVNGPMNVLPRRIDSTLQPNQILYSRNDIIQFMNHLDPEVREEFWFRPFFKESGSIPDEEFILEKFPKTNIIKGNLHKETNKCKLIVLNVPDTTFNISMALNIPCIAYWDHTAIGLDDYAVPYFKQLKDAGIIFCDPISAASKLNEIFQNIDKWWQQSSIQKAKSDWTYQYTRTSKHWRREWIKVIWNL